MGQLLSATSNFTFLTQFLLNSLAVAGLMLISFTAYFTSEEPTY